MDVFFYCTMPRGDCQSGKKYLFFVGLFLSIKGIFIDFSTVNFDLSVCLRRRKNLVGANSVRPPEQSPTVCLRATAGRPYGLAR